MSDALYSTRLRWTRAAGGVAMLHGVRVQLSVERPPIELAGPVECIDYTPEVGVRLVQPLGDRQRDMTPAEIAACDDYLRRACGRKA